MPKAAATCAGFIRRLPIHTSWYTEACTCSWQKGSLRKPKSATFGMLKVLPE